MQIERRFVVDPPKRVLVLGSPGSHRTQAAQAIAARFGLPLIGLDSAKVGLERNRQGWRLHLEALANGSSWAMVGADMEALDLPLARAEWLVYFDLSASLCCVRILHSAIVGRKRAPRNFLRQLRDAWRFPFEKGPAIASAIERERRSRTIFILHTRRDATQFLTDLSSFDPSASDGGVGANS